MTNRLLLAVGILVVSGAGVTSDLLACGEKFLVVSRGTRFQRAVINRQPAKILVFANPATDLPKAFEKASIHDTLRKAGYQPTSVAAQAEFDRAMRQGGWDLIVTGLADGAAIRGQLQGSAAPMLVPVVLNATGTEIAQARKDYQRVIKGPIKSQAFLEAVDDALALRGKLQGRAS
jgi:hypothetical protein